jgi:hypothetical protein
VGKKKSLDLHAGCESQSCVNSRNAKTQFDACNGNSVPLFLHCGVVAVSDWILQLAQQKAKDGHY